MISIASARPVRAALLGALLATVLAACGDSKGAGGPPAFGGPSPVDVMVVQPQTLPVSLEYTGQTQGSREVEVRARVTGIIMKRNYNEGSPGPGSSACWSTSACVRSAAWRTCGKRRGRHTPRLRGARKRYGFRSGIISLYAGYRHN